MNLKWFFSRMVRRAGAMRKHVHKILSAQRDVLSPQAIDAVEAAIAGIKSAEAGGADALQNQMDNLETVANKWLKPYPNAAIRENVEVLLVALAVALGIRTFFLQPFKIPTGSMQPTLWGITPTAPRTLVREAPLNEDNLEIPGAVGRLFDFWLKGESYFNLVAPEDGRLEAVFPPTHLLLFNLRQEYQFNGRRYSVWFPADDLFTRVGYYVRPNSPDVINSKQFKAGDSILKLKTVTGDHLFVDRVSYNFRHPKRGEIVVFETAGIPEDLRTPYQIPPDEFYIKRLIGLGGDRVQISNDRHFVINGQELTTNTPHFANLYNFDPSIPPRESHWSGHANGTYFPDPGWSARYFQTADSVYPIEPHHYMVFGDNTMNSLDSRCWGEFPEKYVVGKYFFVYWPFTSRFGWSVQ